MSGKSRQSGGEIDNRTERQIKESERWNEKWREKEKERAMNKDSTETPLMKMNNRETLSLKRSDG